MKWFPRSEFWWERECKRYTVSRSLYFGNRPDGEWLYVAHARNPWGSSSVISEEARASFEDAVRDVKAHAASVLKTAEVAK